MTAVSMPRASTLAPKWRLAVIVAVALIVCVKWLVSLTGSHVANDDGHNVRMAYNLATHGVLSGDAPDELVTREPRPSNYREPLPPIVLAGFIEALELVDGPKDGNYFREGPGARWLKVSNVLWGGLLCASVFAAVMALTRSTILAAAGTLWVGLSIEANSYLTETTAAALLALSSFLLLSAVRTEKPRDYALCGLALGALVLTKGAFQYIVLVLLAGLAVWFVWRVMHGASFRKAVLSWLALALTCLVVVGPWMARNAFYLGSPQITQRAGIVLLTRAIKNDMTPTEYVGAIYVWAPRSIRSVVGTILGFDKQDLQRGGRLQRLNRNPSDFQPQDLAAEKAGRPEDAISFYRKARAERTKVQRQLNAEGVPDASRIADARLQSRAVDMIVADPWKHLRTTPLFLWRGAFPEAPLLLIVAGLALWWRRPDLFAYVVPAILIIAFYTLLSHNIPRYNEPVFGVLFAALVATGYRLYEQRTGKTVP